MTDEQRATAAGLVRKLIDLAKREPEARETIASICASKGHANLAAYAEADPDEMIMVAEGLLELHDDSDLPRWMG